MRYEYKCECGNIQEEYHSSKEITNKEDDIKHKVQCKACGKVGLERILSGGTGFSKSSAMTFEERKAMMKKRSKDHAAKPENREKFHYLNRRDVMP